MEPKDRLQKYRNELETHLEKVNRALDEEIAIMREKIQATKSALDEKASKEKELQKSIHSKEREIEAIIKGLDTKTAENEKKRAEADQIEHEIANADAELARMKTENSELRSRLDGIDARLNEVNSEMKAIDISGEEKGMKVMIDRAKKDMEDMQRKKATQDAAIERLRKDIGMAERSLKLLDGRLTNEIEKQVQQNTEADGLKHKIRVFETETTGLEDEFAKLLLSLKDKEAGGSQSEAEQRKRDRKVTALLSTSEAYLNEMKQNVEESLRLLNSEMEEVETLRRRRGRAEEEVHQLREEYRKVRRAKGHGDASDSEVSVNQKMNELHSTHIRASSELVEGRKQSVLRLTGSSTKGTPKSSGSSKVNSLMQSKKQILNLKREENALTHKLIRLAEEKTIAEEKLAEKQHELDRGADQLRRAESERDQIGQELEALDSVTVDSKEDKDESEIERRKTELEAVVDRLKKQNQAERSRLENINSSIEKLQSKIAALGTVDMDSFTKDLEQSKTDLRHLKNEHRQLMKHCWERQRELELCVVQRDSTVGRAQSVVHLSTSVRAERHQDIEDIRQRIHLKQKELESLLVD